MIDICLRYSADRRRCWKIVDRFHISVNLFYLALRFCFSLSTFPYFPGGGVCWFDLGGIANKSIRSGGRWARAADAAAAASPCCAHQPCGCPFVIVAQQVSPGPDRSHSRWLLYLRVISVGCRVADCPSRNAKEGSPSSNQLKAGRRRSYIQN